MDSPEIYAMSTSVETSASPGSLHRRHQTMTPVLIHPLDFSLPSSSPSCATTISSPRSRRKPKKNTADSCIKRLCASHQTDIGLLCDLWSSPSQTRDQTQDGPKTGLSLVRASDEPTVVHIAETERQRLLQLEMQLMRMQLQQAELLLPPSRSLPASRTPSEPKSIVETDANEFSRKPELRLPLDEDPTYSLQIAQEEQQNLLWAEADYRAQKRGRSSGSKPTTPTGDSPLDNSDPFSVSPSSLAPEFVNAPLYQGYVKMPRGLFCKFWCAKKRFCMLDSARCFFYWKSKDQMDSGRAKCFSGVTGGVLLPGDDKSIELSYAGGACVVLLKCDTTDEANRLLVALASLESDPCNLPMLDAESIEPGLGGMSHSCSLVSISKSNPELLRRTVAQDCNTRREVIQNAFLDEFRKKQQFEQLLRASKSNSTSSCAREGRLISPSVLKEQRVIV